jgi:iron complex outermembrane receptor protein
MFRGRNSMYRVYAYLLSTSALVVFPATIAAQTRQPPAPAEETVTPDDRHDIIVTGVHDEEGQATIVSTGALGAKPLLDTPFSLSVVDAEDILRRQVTNIGQLFADDPSVSSSAPAASTNWWGTQIRGIGVRNYYVDDVPMALYWGGDFALEPIQSVTALKGLTGFMYGFGSPGGVISYRTKRPTPAPLLTTEIGYRTAGVGYARLDAGGPLTRDGALGYRLNLAGEKGDAYNRAGVNRLVVALALDYRLAPDLYWFATASYEDSRLRHEPFGVYWSQYTDTALPRVSYDYGKLNIANSFYATRTLATATGLDWSFAPDWSVRLTYGYTSKLHHANKMFVNLLDQTGDYRGFAYNFASLGRSHFGQALVQGETATGPVRHEIVVGTSLQANLSDFGPADSHWGNDFNGNLYRDQPFRVTRAIAFGTDGSPSRDQQRALFVSDTLHFGDHVQAMAGARYNLYRLSDTDDDPATDSSYRATALTPTVALLYKPVAYATLYASYAEALEPGSRVDGIYINAGEVLKPAISRQYEVGAKYEHDGLSLTTAAFRIERVEPIDRIEGDRHRLTQDGLTLYKGIEATARYQLTPALRLGAGAIHLDPSIRTVASDNAAMLGHVPGGTSKWQVTGNADYRPPALPGFSLFGNVRYIGPAPTDNDNRLAIPGYTVANAGFQYQTRLGGQPVTVTGNVNNLTDARYWTQTNVGEAINGALSVRLAW